MHKALILKCELIRYMLKSLLQILKITNHASYRFPKAPHFIVAAESWPPHVYLQRSSQSGNLKVSGPMGQLMDALAASLNFT